MNSDVSVILFPKASWIKTVSSTGRAHFPQGRATARTKIVWAVFATAMTAVSGILLLSEDVSALRQGYAFAPAILSNTGTGTSENLTEALSGSGLDPSMDSKQWDTIVIHHSGSVAGTVREMDAQAQRAGLHGLGYHFVIGNGAGLSDGVVQASNRWNQQLAGAHVATPPNASLDECARIDDLNRHSIGICLVGNGDRSEFTEAQIRSMIDLVRALQVRLDIPSIRVVLHSDLADVSSPGRYFPVERLESHIEP